MTTKQQLIQEIEQASEERLAELLLLWQSTRKPTPHHAKFMRFAGIAQQQAELMQQIEQDIESNRQLDLDHPQS